jgi:large repetitive protein
MFKLRGFTLIELLVVMAIIGLLASIVVVNVNSARDKAKTVKGVSFSQQIYSAAGSDCVGYWDFNEIINGNQVRDISGNGNVGTLGNGPALTNGLIFSGGNLGKALSFDGNDDYILIGKLQSVVQPTEITYEAWVNLDSFGDAHHIVGWDWNDSTGMLVGSTGLLVFAMYDASGNWRGFYSSTPINWNTWTHIVVSYSDSQNKVWLYINGVRDTVDNNYSPRAAPQSYNMLIGKTTTAYPGQYYRAKGLIDEVRIYSTALSQAEIQKHYSEELANHLAKNQ